MIRFKFEAEEPETEPLPIESENVVVAAKVPNKVAQKKKLKLDNSTTDSGAVCSRSIKTEPAQSLPPTTSQLNQTPNCSQFQPIDSEFVQSIQQEQSIPNETQQQQSLFSISFEPIVPQSNQLNQVVPLCLDKNSSTNVAVGSKLIKTEPVESLSSFPNSQLNSLQNIQSLVIPNCSRVTIKDEFVQIIQQQPEMSIPDETLFSITIEPNVLPSFGNHQEIPSLVQSSSSIPNGAQHQQSFLLPKTEPIVAEIDQEFPLSLDLSSLIPNLDSEETAEIPSLVQSSSLIPIGTQQQQQSLFYPKIEPIVPEIHQEVPLSLDLSSLIPNLDSEQTAEVPLSLVQSSSSIPIGTQQQQSVLLPKTEPIIPEIDQEFPLSLDLSSLIPNLDSEETAEIPSLVQSSSLIPIGTQQQQSVLLPKTEPIIPEIDQEFPLSLDLSSLIPNLDSEETAEIPLSLVQSSSSIPIGTQQQQSLFYPKIEPIVAEIHQEVPLSLDLSSLIPNLDSEETAEVPLSLVQSSSSIPNGAQHQQSLLLPKTEPIVAEIDQEFPLSLDLSSLIPNLDSEETAEIPSLVQSSSLIPIGTQQQQSFFLPKIEPIVSEIEQEVPSLLDLSSSIPNLEETITNCDTTVVPLLDLSSSIQNFEETTTNCDTTEVPLLDLSSSIPNPISGESSSCDITEMFPGPRAGLGRRAKLNVCYSVPKKPKPVPRRRKKVSEPSPLPSADNSESASNDNEQDSDSISGSISGLDSSSASTSSTTEAEAVPLLIGKKPLRRVPPLTLEERKARKRENYLRWYHRNKANPEIMAGKRRQMMEYNRKYRQQRLANATPEQLELIRLKGLESVRRHMEKETEERRQQRLERVRQYAQKRKQQLLDSGTPEQLEQIRLKEVERNRRRKEKETEEQRKRRLERVRQYDRNRKQQLLDSGTPEQLEQRRLKEREKYRRHKEKETEEKRQRRLARQRQNKRMLAKRRKDQKREKFSTLTSNHLNHPSTSTITNDNNNGMDIGTITSKRKKRKPDKKRLELSMDDSDSVHFDIGDSGGSGDETISQMQSPKPGPSKLPRPTRCQRNLKSKIYLESSTDTDLDDSD